MIIFLIAALAAALLLFAFISAGAGKGRSRGHRAGPRRGHTNHAPAMSSSEIRGRWDTILAISQSGPGGLKNAITEADKLFDHVLRQQGLPGDTMGDRLKAARSRFSGYPVYDGLWRAHKLRNALAHEVGFDLVPSQAREALSDFERGLRDLGAL